MTKLPKWEVEAQVRKIEDLKRYDVEIRQRCLHEAVTNNMSGTNSTEIVEAAAKYYDFVTGVQPKQPKKRK